MAQGPLGSPSYSSLSSMAERTLSPEPVWGPAHWLRQSTWEGRFWPDSGPSYLPPYAGFRSPDDTLCGNCSH